MADDDANNEPRNLSKPLQIRIGEELRKIAADITAVENPFYFAGSAPGSAAAGCAGAAASKRC
jgi:hypothetical protein